MKQSREAIDLNQHVLGRIDTYLRDRQLVFRSTGYMNSLEYQYIKGSGVPVQLLPHSEDLFNKKPNNTTHFLLWKQRQTKIIISNQCLVSMMYKLEIGNA